MSLVKDTKVQSIQCIMKAVRDIPERLFFEKVILTIALLKKITTFAPAIKE